MGITLLALLLLLSTLMLEGTSTVEAAFVKGKTWEYNYTGGSQTFTIVDSGKYKIETYGAQGGGSGGLGGKTEAIYDLYPNESLTILVGGTDGYNGGGTGEATGGGATTVKNGASTLAIGAGGGGGAGGTAGGNGSGVGGASDGKGSGGNGTLGGGGGKSYSGRYSETVTVPGYNDDRSGYDDVWGNVYVSDRFTHSECGVQSNGKYECVAKFEKVYEWRVVGQKWVTNIVWVPPSTSTVSYTAAGRPGTGGTNSVSPTGVSPIMTNGVQTGNGKVVITAIEPHDDIPPTIKLTPSVVSSTNGTITITADIVDDKSGVASKKWMVGGQKVGVFTTSGNALGGSFVVTDNGDYTVYALDGAGNAGVKTIKITGINKSSQNAPQFIPDVVNSTSGDVKVEVVYSAGSVKKQYQVDGGAWVDYTKPVVFSQNGVISARSYDTAGNMSKVTKLTVGNINKANVSSPRMSLSATTVTNKDMEVTITYPSNSVEKQVSVDGGAWETYDRKVKVSENMTIKARAKAVTGGMSAVSKTQIKNIDKDAPTVVVTGIKNNGVYYKSVTPNIRAWDYSVISGKDIDLTSVSNVLLNGKPYNGTPIKDAGKYVLTVTVKDSVGNETVESYSFTVL